MPQPRKRHSRQRARPHPLPRPPPAEYRRRGAGKGRPRCALTPPAPASSRFSLAKTPPECQTEPNSAPEGSALPPASGQRCAGRWLTGLISRRMAAIGSVGSGAGAGGGDGGRCSTTVAGGGSRGGVGNGGGVGVAGDSVRMGTGTTGETRNRQGPRPTTSSACSRTDSWIRRPLTTVPLLEWRSSMVIPVSRNVNSAWRSLISGCRRRILQASPRPMV